MKLKILIFSTIFILGLFIAPLFVLAAEKDCPPKDGTIVLQVNIPGVTYELCKSGNTKYYGINDYNGDGKKDMTDFFALLYRFLVGLAGIAAVIAMMVGGYMWLFSGGNASKVGEAKSIIGSAVFGLFLTIGSFMILNLINPDLVNWKFNPNKIETPTLANFANVKRICTAEERSKAVGELYKNKDKTKINPTNDFRCGSVYYPKHWEYEIACSKGKEETPECLKTKSEAFQDGCMDVSCPMDGNADYICSIQADSKGSLASGACVNKISAIRENSKENKTFSVSETNSFLICGQAYYGAVVFDVVSPLCDAEKDFLGTGKFTTCSVVSDSSLNFEPDNAWINSVTQAIKASSYGKIYGMYKEKKMFMGCRDGHLKQFTKPN